MARSRPTKVVLGLLTAAPLVFFFGAVGFGLLSALFSFGSDFPIEFFIGMAGISYLAVFVVGLPIAFIMWIVWLVEVIRRPDLSSDRRLLWVVVVMLGSSVGQLVYFFMEVWPDAPILDQPMAGMVPPGYKLVPEGPPEPPRFRLAHIVLWKLKLEAEGVTRRTNALEMKRRLEALREVIPEIIRLDVGLNIEQSDAAWDVALYTEFADEVALAAYQAHPEHVKVAEWIAEIRSDRAVVDYPLG